MSLKKNVIANYMGQGWTAVMGLVFVPFYIQLLGIESYGLIGIYTSIVMMMAVLDLGLSQVMTRELAKYSGDNTINIVDTVKTLEIIYWVTALVMLVIVMASSHWLAYQWLTPESLSRETLQEVVGIIAFVIALRWPIAIYAGGLNGLQEQVLVNKILVLFSTIQSGGVLLVLIYIEPSVQLFFIWQALVAAVNVMVFRYSLWGKLPRVSRPRFSKMVLSKTWRFAAGMTGISLLTTLLTQLDKIILSKILSLPDFGYYTFAATVAGVVFRLVGPVFTGYYPRMTELVSTENYSGLVKTYHQGTQLIAVMIFPIALIFIVYSSEILMLWTRDANLVLNSSILVSLLLVGNVLNGVMHLPYALQLAHGWTKLAFYANVIAVIFLLPAIYFASIEWGAVGAVTVWIILNIGYLLITVNVMHNRLLKEERFAWYLNDLATPLISVIGVVVASYYIRETWLGSYNGIILVIFIVVTLLLSITSAVMSSSVFRKLSMSYFRGYK